MKGSMKIKKIEKFCAICDTSPDTSHKDIIVTITTISEILKNSIVPVELALTKVFHIAGTRVYTNSFIPDVADNAE